MFPFDDVIMVVFDEGVVSGVSLELNLPWPGGHN